MTRIARYNKVMRGEREIEYKFQTFDFIFKESKAKPNLTKLRGYLKHCFINGLEESSSSVSQAPLLMCDVVERREREMHWLRRFAELSGYRGEGNRQHDILQEYFLNECGTCIATEVPIFDGEYSGRIDVLVYLPEHDKVMILDFKPNAHKENKAGSQLIRYRNGIVLGAEIHAHDISMVYFDENNVYEVK